MRGGKGGGGGGGRAQVGRAGARGSGWNAAATPPLPTHTPTPPTRPFPRQDKQRDALLFAKKLCGSFRHYADECVTDVELYAPIVFNAAAQYVTPELCDSLGVCPAGLVRPGAEAAAAASA